MDSFLPFKHRKPFAFVPLGVGVHYYRNRINGAGKRETKPSRKNEVAAIQIKFPGKVPVILERYSKEKMLPALNKIKFLVPQELTMGQFVTIIRNRMSVGPTQAFYFLVNSSRSLVNMSSTMAEVYATFKDEDGFLYMTYASQEMFG